MFRFENLRRLYWAPVCLALFLAACDSPEERAEKHYQKGQSLIEEGLSEKAVLEFRSALEQDEKHVPTHFALGLALEDQGNLGAAFQQFRHVVDLDPGHLEARLKTARYYLVGGDRENMAVEVEALLKLDPVNPSVQALRGKLALLNNELEEARQAIEEALALDPANVEALSNDVGYTLRTRSAEAALARLDEALALQEKSFGLHMLKLQLLQRIGDTDGLQVQLGTMVDTFPDNLGLRESRVRWAIENNRPELARVDLEYLADHAPDQTLAIVNLVRLVQQQDGPEAARAILVDRVATAEDADQLRMILAQFDVDTGQRDLALTGLRELAGSGSEEANTARLALARLLTASSDAPQQDVSEAEAVIAAILVEDPTHTGALAFEAERLIAGDRYNDAIQIIRTGLNADPEDIQLLLLAGRTQELLGNIDLANDRMAKGVRQDAYNPRTSEPYARFLLRHDRLKAAEIVLTETARHHPKNRQVVDMLGFTQVRLGNWFGAEETLKMLQPLDPERAVQLNAAILIEREQFTEGAKLLATLPESERRRENSIVAAVQAYLRAGDAAKAAAFLDGLIAENPRDIQALGIRGNLHLISGEIEAAEQRYREILEIEPANGNAFSALSRLAARDGDRQRVTAILDEGLSADPDNINLLARRALEHEKAGEYSQAIALYEKVYDRAPGMPVIANNLASLLADHAAGDPEVIARAHAIASRLKTSEIPQFRDTYGWTRFLNGEYDEALSYIEPLTEALPDNPWVWYHLAKIYVAVDRQGDARIAYEAALEKGGDDFVRADEISATLAEFANN